MNEIDKAFIYFDTNSIECRHSGKALYLSQFTVNPLYYRIEELIQELGLQEKVEICIPEIVWYELQEHLKNYFKAEKDSMRAKIESFRKSFGNLAEISCEFKDCVNEIEYAEYVTDIANDFLESPRVTAKIISCPKDELSIQQIIEEAVHSIKPFHSTKINGKKYTDAGFKDALIFKTIIQHTGNQLGIFISRDNDFIELFNENKYDKLKICTNEKEVQEVLKEVFEIAPTDTIENILKTDDYLKQRILTECGFDENSRIYDINVFSSEKMVSSDTNVQFIMTVNGIKYFFDVIYNINAKELIEASCELYDKDEREDN